MGKSVERGTAHIKIELADGTVTMLHGDGGQVFAEMPNVAEGEWSQLFHAIESLVINLETVS